jgi:hypothetical protein
VLHRLANLCRSLPRWLANGTQSHWLANACSPVLQWLAHTCWSLLCRLANACSTVLHKLAHLRWSLPHQLAGRWAYSLAQDWLTHPRQSLFRSLAHAASLTGPSPVPPTLAMSLQGHINLHRVLWPHHTMFTLSGHSNHAAFSYCPQPSQRVEVFSVLSVLFTPCCKHNENRS